MSYRDVMEMPLRGFWSFNANVDRLRAEEKLAMMEMFLLGGMGASGDDLKVMQDRLLKDMKEPMKSQDKPIVDPQKDREVHREGIAKLKQIAMRMKK